MCEAHYRRERRHGSPTAGGISRRVPTYTRFLEQVIKGATLADCDLWAGNVVTNPRSGIQYGRFKVSGVNTLVHRWLYQHLHGVTLTTGEVVRHTCDVSLCVNPNHLLLGTQADNIQDCIDRGRAWWQNR